MPSATDRQPAVWPAILWVTVSALVVVALCTVAVSRQNSQRRLEASADANQALAARAAAIAAVVSRADQVTSSVAGSVAAAGELSSIGGALIGVDLTDLVDVVAVRAGQPLPTAVDSETVRSALDQSTDTGGTVVAAPHEESAVAVHPLHRVGGQLTADTAALAAPARRASIAGWIITRIEPDVFVGVDLSTPRGRLPVGAADELVTVQMVVPGGIWGVGVPVRPVGTAIPSSVMALGVGWLVMSVVAGVSVRRRWASLVATTAAAQRQGRMIAETAAHAQRSLDLGELLPGVIVDLCDRLDARGATCSTTTGTGVSMDAFTHGDTTGEPMSMSLSRAGRSMGELRLYLDRELLPAEMEAVEMSVDLLAGALLHARAFADQRAMLRAQEDLGNATTTFLSVASHELRTPVAAIGGFAGALVAGWESLPDDDRLHVVERIQANAGSMSRIVADLLDFARLEQGRLRVELEPLDLSAVATAVVDQTATVFGEARTSVEVEPNLMVHGDRTGIERILTNLLSNAHQYSPEHAPITVRVLRDRDDGRPALIVDDGGAGVPAEERALIFGQFFRGSGQEVVRTKGAGIGLSVVAEFVRRMDAEIDVGVSPHGGARFRVRFPEWEDDDEA